MNKIILYFCFFLLFGCAGFEPLFSSKNISYYIIEIENINKNDVTKKISKKLSVYKKNTNSEKGYLLKLSADTRNIIVSKDAKGQVSSYKMIVDVNLEVLSNNSTLPISVIKLTKDFIYQDQKNKFEQKQYQKDILENLIDKISQEIVIKLQSL
jgi:outer membrane lipopolysaccharide assembly protein LptE/RlpB